MRKYITLIFALALMSLGLNAQSGRGSGLSGKGLDGFIEQTQLDSIHVTAGKFVYGTAGSGQEVTATGVELSVLAGISGGLTSDELDYLDISSLGTGAPSKAVVLDANGSYTWLADDTLFYAKLNDGTTTLTASALEINVVDGISANLTYDELDYLDLTGGAGISEATKAVVLDGDRKIDSLDITILSLGGIAVTATATQINNFATTSSTGTELDVLAGVTGGTSAADKAVVLDGSSKIDALDITALTINGTLLGATATEIDVLAGVTGGTRTVSKAIVVDGSGTIDALDITTLSIGTVAITATAAELNSVADKSASTINATTTLPVTVAEHSERYITLDNNAGFTSTLPVATGSGNKYVFVVVTTISSGDYIIKVGDGSDIMIGQAWIVDDDATPGVGKNWLTDNTNDDTITLDGSTTGGIIGDKIILIDIAADTWSVQIYGRATGTESTPFSATV